MGSEIQKVLATSVDKFGRPSKLTPEMIQKAWDYIRTNTEQALEGKGQLPTKERLALTLNVSRQTMDDWKEHSAEFLDILRTLEHLQADMLLQNGLTGKYNPTIAKLLLSKHGYVEKTEQDTRHTIVQPILNGDSVKKEIDDTPR